MIVMAASLYITNWRKDDRVPTIAHDRIDKNTKSDIEGIWVLENIVVRASTNKFHQFFEADHSTR